jgi:hypothetical protein
MKLLNSGNAKTRKGEKLGYITYGMHLAPANLSGFNVCQYASAGCAAACLNTAGRGAMSSVQKARIAKTRLFFTDKEKFLSMLWDEVQASIKSAKRKNMIPCFRLNLTSDLPWEKIKRDGVNVMEAFPQVQFYDYTKIPTRMLAYRSSLFTPHTWAGSMGWTAQGGRDWPKNYQLTFSRSECNAPDVGDVMSESGVLGAGNVAMVFRKTLPSQFMGRQVVDGDETDLRFLDPQGVIVGLVEKGLAKRDASGFVLEPTEGGAQ